MRKPIRLFPFLKNLTRVWSLERPAVLAAALAYYGMFALAPILFISLSIAGFFVDQLSLSGKVYEAIATYLGPEITRFLQDAVANLYQPNSSFPLLGTLISIGAILYAASGLFYHLQYSLNVIWKVPPPERDFGRFLLKQRLVSLVMVAASGVIMITALMVFGILAWANSTFQVGLNLSIANPLVFWLLVSLSFSLIYKFIPLVKVHWRQVIPGAMGAGMLITIFVLLFGSLLGSGAFRSTFAASGAVVMVLVGLNLFANIFLLGALVGRLIREAG